MWIRFAFFITVLSLKHIVEEQHIFLEIQIILKQEFICMNSIMEVMKGNEKKKKEKERGKRGERVYQQARLSIVHTKKKKKRKKPHPPREGERKMEMRLRTALQQSENEK